MRGRYGDGLAMIRLRFRPRDLRTRSKISLIFLLLLVPIGYAVRTIVVDRQAQIAMSERELTGILSIDPELRALMKSRVLTQEEADH